MNFKAVMSFALLLLLMSACSKDLDEYNKPATYWYQKMVDSIATANLEKADDYYSSLQSEHINSPFLPEATIILANAHMNEEEYLLAGHFFDEYIRRYADMSEREYAEFMKIKAKYLSLPNPRRDQGLINSTIEMAQSFEKRYPYSNYYALVDTMQSRLLLARASLN